MPPSPFRYIVMSTSPASSNRVLVLDTAILIETTQTDDDGSTETILAPIAVELTNAPPIPLVEYFTNTDEDVRQSGNLLEDNVDISKPVRLYEIAIDTNGDGILDTIEDIPRGGSVTIDTVKGQFIFYSNADWVLDAARNLDHNLTQQVDMALSIYDALGNPAVGQALFSIRDGAQGVVTDSTYQITEANLPGSSVDSASFIVNAGSDNVAFQSVRFSRESAFIIERLNLTSNNVDLIVERSVDGEQITAFIGPTSNGDIAFQIFAVASPADADGNSTVEVTLELFAPLDHDVLNNTIQFSLPVIGDDTDGTDLLTGDALIKIIDGNDPTINITSPVTIDEATVDQASITVSGQINVDVGSDAIATVGFLDTANYPSLTSNGYEVFYRIVNNGTTLEAYVSEPVESPVFTVDIDGSADATMASSVVYNFTLFRLS